MKKNASSLTFYVTCLLACLLGTNFCFGQVRHFMSLGPDLGIPTKSFGNAKVGFGGSFDYQMKFKGPVGLQGHLGYSSFSHKGSLSGTVSFLPARIGIIGYFYEDFLFAFADAGISRYHSSTTGTSQTGFSFGTGAGYRLPLSSGQFAQFSAYYNLHHYNNDQSDANYNYNWFNLRVAYGLSFGKKVPLNNEYKK